MSAVPAFAQQHVASCSCSGVGWFNGADYGNQSTSGDNPINSCEWQSLSGDYAIVAIVALKGDQYTCPNNLTVFGTNVTHNW